VLDSAVQCRHRNSVKRRIRGGNSAAANAILVDPTSYYSNIVATQLGNQFEGILVERRHKACLRVGIRNV
jgi:hypothetical protein